MITVTLDEKSSLAVLEPHDALSEEDFKYASSIIDPFINEHGHLKGIIIYVESFPGWDSFTGLVSHLKFINEHHKKVSYVLFVTDSTLLDVVEPITKHFVSATVKIFPFNALQTAKEWVQNQ